MMGEKYKPTKSICECGESLVNSAFLSRTFGYDGGTMIFRCQCGKETRRFFIPSDLLTIEESLRILTEQTFGKEFSKLAVAEYRKVQSAKRLKIK